MGLIILLIMMTNLSAVICETQLSHCFDLLPVFCFVLKCMEQELLFFHSVMCLIESIQGLSH